MSPQRRLLTGPVAKSLSPCFRYARMFGFLDQLAAARADRQQEPHTRLLAPFAGPVHVRMCATHVWSHRATGWNGRITGMLELPMFDGVRERFADRECGGLLEIAETLWIGARDLRLYGLLARMDRQVRLTAEIAL